MKNGHPYLLFLHLMMTFFTILFRLTQSTLLSIMMLSSLHKHFAIIWSSSCPLNCLGVTLKYLDIHWKQAIQLAWHGKTNGFLKISKQIGQIRFLISKYFSIFTLETSILNWFPYSCNLMWSTIRDLHRTMKTTITKSL